MQQITLQESDFVQVAQARAAEEPLFAMQVKCMALIRMLEQRTREYVELEEKYLVLTEVESHG